MRLRSFIASIAAIPVLLLSACGTADTPKAPAPSATPAAATPTASPTPTAAKSSGKELILATTTSTQDSGLLDVLVPLYERQTGDKVKVIAVGSGAALELGRKGNADVLLVHSPAAEEAYMKEGAGINRTRVMYNDFVIVGPAADPAKIKGQKDSAAAMKLIADAKAPFFSRGDNSGTHAAEQTLWKAANLAVPKGQAWYAETGQGMGLGLFLAAASTITATIAAPNPTTSLTACLRSIVIPFRFCCAGGSRISSPSLSASWPASAPQLAGMANFRAASVRGGLVMRVLVPLVVIVVVEHDGHADEEQIGRAHV